MGTEAQVSDVIELLEGKFPGGAPTDEDVRRQGFHWSPAQWRKRWPSELALPEQLRDEALTRPYITRQDVFDRARRVETPSDAVELFLLMAAWGTGTKARSIARVALVLHQDRALEKLLSSHQAVLEGDAVEAYRRLYSRDHDRIKHFGPAFFTKWIYFCSYDTWDSRLAPPPLILDKRVAESLDWPTHGWSADTYGEYLNLATTVRDAWAPGEPTHVIEYALFQPQKIGTPIRATTDRSSRRTTTLERDEDGAAPEEIEWALAYNAYERLAKSPNDLGRLLEPARDGFLTTGCVPEWCGVDLLRGWAFYLVREDYFSGGGTLGREWQAVMTSLINHPAGRGEDLPPRAGPHSD
ncbi:8-oxoguanine DNA glycosylase OGG fold protein [Citricoccus parietis]|uniref:8-oxoguanine DNA glycosylase OGG fold protein n=1 Tax=Citricoccus parietis TaxID=592307 RepID=UPI00366CF0E9